MIVKCFIIMACLSVLFLSAPTSAMAQRIGSDPSKVLDADEMAALKELQGGRAFRSVGVTVNEQARLVNLHFNRELAETDLPFLRRIKKLGILFFVMGQAPVSDDGLRLLEGVGMQGLVIWRAQITDQGLKALKRFPKLEHVTLQQTEVTDAGMVVLTELPGLKRVDVAFSAITDVGLAHLSKMTQLEQVSFFHCNKISDEGISRLATLINLRKLFLNNTLAGFRRS
jgi:hypothetical protein